MARAGVTHFENDLDEMLFVHYSELGERPAQSDRRGSADVGRDQYGRHRISACACWVGYRDGGNWVVTGRSRERWRSHFECGSR